MTQPKVSSYIFTFKNDKKRRTLFQRATKFYKLRELSEGLEETFKGSNEPVAHFNDEWDELGG